MTTERLNCGNCGAPLDVPRTARFVTCNQCDAQLTIQRSGSVTYTETGAEPALQHLSDRVDDLTRQNELLRLDRDWDVEKEQYMRTGRYGQRYRPTVGMSIFTGVAAILGGSLWTVFASGIAMNVGGLGAVFPVFGVLFVCVGAGIAIYNYNLATGYDQAYAAYQRRRHELLDGRPGSVRPDDS